MVLNQSPEPRSSIGDNRDDEPCTSGLGTVGLTEEASVPELPETEMVYEVSGARVA